MKRHLILLVPIIGFLINLWACVAGQEIKEYPDSKSHDFWYNKTLPFPDVDLLKQESNVEVLTIQGLLSLLKEYQTYCDTIAVTQWEYFGTQIFKPDSTLKMWKLDSSLVRTPRKHYRSPMFLFPEDFINWLAIEKLRLAKGRSTTSP